MSQPITVSCGSWSLVVSLQLCSGFRNLQTATQTRCLCFSTVQWLDTEHALCSSLVSRCLLISTTVIIEQIQLNWLLHYNIHIYFMILTLSCFKILLSTRLFKISAAVSPILVKSLPMFYIFPSVNKSHMQKVKMIRDNSELLLTFLK